VVLPQSRLNFAGDRFQMRLRRSRTDDEKIGEGRDLAQIEHHNVFGLFVGGEVRAGFR
jgi:hypothetical protein